MINSKLVSILQYKCDWYGKKLIQVNPAYTRVRLKTT
ncbi:zinc ribbon domain-containing protein [Limosilactobacillus fermentum]